MLDEQEDYRNDVKTLPNWDGFTEVDPCDFGEIDPEYDVPENDPHAQRVV